MAWDGARWRGKAWDGVEKHGMEKRNGTAWDGVKPDDRLGVEVWGNKATPPPVAE